MSTAATPARRLAPVRRGDEARVTPLELFFDLVFVLAITQVTALIADEPTWRGLAKGVLVMALLWWTWAGYRANATLAATLQSINDPVQRPSRYTA